jgi:ADP-heptose:LPS heptosyltransferase
MVRPTSIIATENSVPRRIIVLRALALGDLLCAVPAFRSLRRALPNAEIVLVGLPWARWFAARFHRYIDGYREFPGFPGLPERSPLVERIPSFLAEIQQERFDLAIQLHGSGSFVNPLITLFGARKCAGFFSSGDYCPDPECFMPWPGEGLEIHRLLSLMTFLGIRARGEELEFPLDGRDLEDFKAIPEAKALKPGAYICIHAGASVAERRWPAEGFAVVGRVLADRGWPIVLTGTAPEADVGRVVACNLVRPHIDLTGRTSLGSFGVLLGQAKLLISNDTGVSHIAAALKVPSVVISTGNNPARWAPTDHNRHRVLCSPNGVSVNEVIGQAESLLATYESLTLSHSCANQH